MVSLVFINSHFKSNLFMCDHESSHYLTGNLMFCAQSNGYETIVNEIKALNAGGMFERLFLYLLKTVMYNECVFMIVLFSLSPTDSTPSTA